jgi:hypothetical protein
MFNELYQFEEYYGNSGKVQISPAIMKYFDRTIPETRYKADRELDVVFTFDLFSNLMSRNRIKTESQCVLLPYSKKAYTESYIQAFPSLQVYKTRYHLSLGRVKRVVEYLSSNNFIRFVKGESETRLALGDCPEENRDIKAKYPFKNLEGGEIIYYKRLCSRIYPRPWEEWSIAQTLEGWDKIELFLYETGEYNRFFEQIIQKNTNYRHLALLTHSHAICIDNDKNEDGEVLKKRKDKKSKKIKKLITGTTPEIEERIKSINSGIISSPILPEHLKPYFLYNKIFGKEVSLGGRNYSVFNRIEKKDRRILLDQIGYSELDTKNLGLQVMYKTLTGKFYFEIYPDHDFYEDFIERLTILDYDLNPKTIKALRPFVKKIISAALSCSSEHEWRGMVEFGEKEESLRTIGIEYADGDRSRENPKRWKEYLRNHKLDIETPKPPMIRFQDLVIALSSFEPLREHWFKARHGYIQNIESRMMDRLSLDAISDGYPPLTIFDSICVPNREEVIEKYESNLYKYLEEEIIARFQELNPGNLLKKKWGGSEGIRPVHDIEDEAKKIEKQIRLFAEEDGPPAYDYDAEYEDEDVLEDIDEEDIEAEEGEIKEEKEEEKKEEITVSEQEQKTEEPSKTIPNQVFPENWYQDYLLRESIETGQEKKEVQEAVKQEYIILEDGRKLQVNNYDEAVYKNRREENMNTIFNR